MSHFRGYFLLKFIRKEMYSLSVEYGLVRKRIAYSGLVVILVERRE
jgi:hypothetical protein